MIAIKPRVGVGRAGLLEGVSREERGGSCDVLVACASRGVSYFGRAASVACSALHREGVVGSKLRVLANGQSATGDGRGFRKKNRGECRAALLLTANA